MESLKYLLVVGADRVMDPIQERLLSDGYTIWSCDDGATARQRIQHHGLPHLMIVNVSLPDMNGLALCREVQRLADPPIIALSFHNRPGAAVQALECADDYLQEPIDPEELYMRIHRVLSRINSFSYTAATLMEICGSLKIDYLNRCVVVDGERRQLTPTENALLHVLLKHWGKVVDSDTLIKRAWLAGIRINDRNALRVHMHRLRRKVERDPAKPDIIVTEYGVGYAFMGC
jgi:DNA-binding response OmpR family regulator